MKRHFIHNLVHFFVDSSLTIIIINISTCFDTSQKNIINWTSLFQNQSFSSLVLDAFKFSLLYRQGECQCRQRNLIHLYIEVFVYMLYSTWTVFSGMLNFKRPPPNQIVPVKNYLWHVGVSISIQINDSQYSCYRKRYTGRHCGAVYPETTPAKDDKHHCWHVCGSDEVRNTTLEGEKGT